MRTIALVSLGLVCNVIVTIRYVWISHNDFFGKPESKKYHNVFLLLGFLGIVSIVAAFYCIVREERRKLAKRE